MRRRILSVGLGIYGSSVESRQRFNTVGHTEIHAWGNRVSRFGYGQNAVIVEPRIPVLRGGNVNFKGGLYS